MKNIITTFILFMVMISSQAIETNHYDSLFNQGNSAYQNQDFEAALTAYSSILETGFESADLFYNTGNCHFKLNQITQAILYFEKALKLNPTSKDILYNLELANKQIVDKIEVLPVPFYGEWWTVLTNSLPMDMFAILCIVFVFIAVFFLLLYFRTNNGIVKRLSFFLTIVTLLVGGLTFLFAKSQFTQNYESNNAIIISSRVNIYSAPNTTSTTLFILHDGLKVAILQTENKWNKIMLPDGSIGWIPEEALVKI